MSVDASTSQDGIRTKPMKLIVLGMARTGTMSQRAALIRLGYTPFHMHEILMSDRRVDLWREAFDSKFSASREGKCSLTRREWDILLGDYDSCLDLPTAAFMPELAAIYPEAQIVIAQRPAEKWYESYSNTVMRGSRPSVYLPLLLDPFMNGRSRLLMRIGLVWSPTYDASRETVMRRYDEIHDEARRTIEPKDRILEWQLAQGWEPLCEFLGRPVPKDEPFPHVNDTKAFLDNMYAMRNASLVRVVAIVAGSIGTFGLLYSRYGRGIRSAGLGL